MSSVAVMKKLLSLMLILMLLSACFTVPSFAAAAIGEQIADRMFAVDGSGNPIFDTADREMLSELIELFIRVDDVDGLANAYEKTFETLAGSGRDTRFSSMGGSVAVMRAFAELIKDEVNDLTLDKFRSYLGLDGATENPAAFAAAIDRRQAEFQAAITAGGNDIDGVGLGIARLDKIFTLLGTSKVFHTEVFTYCAGSRTMALNDDRARKVVQLANDILANDISDVDNCVEAMREMPDYFNGANNNDKDLMYQYLNKYGFLITVNPADNPNPPPGPQTTPSNQNKKIIVPEREIPLAPGDILLDLADEGNNKVSTEFTMGMWNEEKKGRDYRFLSLAARAGLYDLSEYTFTLDYAVLRDMINSKIDSFSLSTDMGGLSFNAGAFESVLSDFLKNDPVDAWQNTKLVFDEKRIIADQAFINALPAGQKDNIALGSAVYDVALTLRKADGNPNANNTPATKILTSSDLFNSPVLATFPYELGEGENPNALRLCYLASDGSLENTIGAYDASLNELKAHLDHSGKYAIMPVAIPFTDINDVPGAKSALEAMYARGVMTGDGKTRITPKANVTRAQFAIMICRALKLTDSINAAQFKDVNNKHWAYRFIMTASKAGLISGYNSIFNPDDPISREDMAMIIRKAIILTMGEDALPEAAFADIAYSDKNKISSYAREGIAQLYELGIPDTRSDDSFAPLEPATRAEAAILIYKCMNLMFNIHEQGNTIQ